MFCLAGSIEVGITTHNPDLIEFPATMTNLNSGTLFYSDGSPPEARSNKIRPSFKVTQPFYYPMALYIEQIYPFLMI